MGNSGPISKICALCGQDCANRPRVKDASGRYCCQACYDAATAAQQAIGKKSEAPPVSAPPPPPAIEDEPQPYTVQSTTCSVCGATCPPDAQACPNCLASLRAGYEGPPRQRALPSAPIWPIVIGIFCCIFGGGGILLYGAGALSSLAISPPPNSDPAYQAGYRLGAVSVTLLALLPAFGLVALGIGLCMRRPFAAPWLKAWAIVKIILTVTCVGVLMARFLLGEFDGVGEFGLTTDESMMATLGVILGSVIWLLFWPAFILIWFARVPIRKQVAEWS